MQISSLSTLAVDVNGLSDSRPGCFAHGESALGTNGKLSEHHNWSGRFGGDNSQSIPSVEQRFLDPRDLSVVTISIELYLLQFNINMGQKTPPRNFVLLVKIFSLLKILVFCDTTPYESTWRHLSEVQCLHQYHWWKLKSFYTCFQTNVINKEKRDEKSEHFSPLANW